MNKLIFRLLVIGLFVLASEKADACHALAVTGFNVTNVAGGIEIDANSTSPTCGCGAYWLDIEIRCINENFDGAPFDPTQYLALSTYPYFQSATMLKPSCTVQAYPTTFVPFGSLCAGINYQVRVRENNNGNGGPWSAPLQFTVPGTYTPFTSQINATSLTVCDGDCATVEAVVTGGCTQAPVFNWNSGQASTPSVTVCPELDTTLYVTIVEQCTGDIIQDSITIEVVDTIAAGDATIMPSIGGTPGLITNACEGETVSLMLEGYAGDIQWQEAPGPGGPWVDIPGGTLDTTITDPVVTNTCFRAEIEGCGDLVYSNEICVEIAPKPNLNVPDYLVCQGESLDLIANVDLPGGDFMWNDVPSQNQTELLNNFPVSNTEYFVQYELNGCIVYDTSIVTVNATPNPDFFIDTVCEGDGTLFNDATTIDNNNGDVIDTYSWNFDDGNTSNQANPTNNYATEGAYNVQLIVTSNFGCVDSVTIESPVYPNPVVDFSPTDACLEIENQFNDFSTVSNNLTQNNIQVWNWDFGDGNVSSDQNPQHEYANAGGYNVTLEVVTNNGCSTSFTNQVTVHPKPNVSFNTTPIAGCTPVCFNIASTSQVGGGSFIENYRWTYSNGVSFNYGVGDSIHTDCLSNPTSNPIILGVELEITTDKGCVNSLNEPNLIEIYQNPIAEFDYSPYESDILSPVVEFNNTSVLADSVVWNIENYGVLTEYSPTIEFDNENPEIYDVELMAFTDEGCKDSAYARIDIKDVILFYVPNTFTPDFDEFNQTFQPVFTSGFDPLDFNMLIFNRYGEVIFETNNAAVGWDGTYGASSSEIVKDGTYVWKIEFKETMSDKRHVHTGHINILR